MVNVYTPANAYNQGKPAKLALKPPWPDVGWTAASIADNLATSYGRWPGTPTALIHSRQRRQTRVLCQLLSVTPGMTWDGLSNLLFIDRFLAIDYGDAGPERQWHYTPSQRR